MVLGMTPSIYAARMLAAEERRRRALEDQDRIMGALQPIPGALSEAYAASQRDRQLDLQEAGMRQEDARLRAAAADRASNAKAAAATRAAKVDEDRRKAGIAAITAAARLAAAKGDLEPGAPRQQITPEQYEGTLGRSMNMSRIREGAGVEDALARGAEVEGWRLGFEDYTKQQRERREVDLAEKAATRAQEAHDADLGKTQGANLKTYGDLVEELAAGLAPRVRKKELSIDQAIAQAQAENFGGIEGYNPALAEAAVRKAVDDARRRAAAGAGAKTSKMPVRAEMDLNDAEVLVAQIDSALGMLAGNDKTLGTDDDLDTGWWVSGKESAKKVLADVGGKRIGLEPDPVWQEYSTTIGLPMNLLKNKIIGSAQTDPEIRDLAKSLPNVDDDEVVSGVKLQAMRKVWKQIIDLYRTKYGRSAAPEPKTAPPPPGGSGVARSAPVGALADVDDDELQELLRGGL